MDQDAFRTLVVTPGASSSGASRGSLLSHGTRSVKPSKSISDSAQAAFKPRKVKKAVPDGYRDRAAERRVGDVNEYADVEALLENFEKRATEGDAIEDIEAQRKYLGGDEKHTVLVKGLDFALLEQRKAQTGSKADDDALEEAFAEAAAPSAPQPKKRTRDDLLKELKSKRDSAPHTKDDSSPAKEGDALEKAKQMGKFRPIGTPSVDSKPKEEKRKKKKRKVAAEVTSSVKEVKDPPQKNDVVEPSPAPNVTAPSSIQNTHTVQNPTADIPAPVPLRMPSEAAAEPDEDIDIFADVGEYEGMDLGDDDESDGGGKQAQDIKPADSKDLRPKTVNWFDDPEPDTIMTAPLPTETTATTSPPPPIAESTEDAEEQPARLAPLASSSIRDIKGFLELDKELERAEKKKARKEKNKKKD